MNNNVVIFAGNSPFANKLAEMQRTSQIPLHSFIDRKNVLAMALYCGDAEECVSYLKNPPSKMALKAAEIAKDFHLHPQTIPCHKAFFNNNLMKLLEIAKSNPDYGAKLAPGFCRMVNYAGEHHLSHAVLVEVIDFLYKVHQSNDLLTSELQRRSFGAHYQFN